VRENIVVLGAGPAGLAVGAMLREHGLDPLLVDRADSVGSSWRHHYDRLHLHTARISHLPGLRMPRSTDGSWLVPTSSTISSAMPRTITATRARHDRAARRARRGRLAARLRRP
jgi:cation diffusion facilitator CzcD-associated flavoprotein CzcO